MSETPKWTPGPWVRAASPHDVVLSQEPRRMIECVTLQCRTEERREANAHLIAAAPKLYEALKTARMRMLRYGEDPQEIAEIDAALAKARGEV